MSNSLLLLNYTKLQYLSLIIYFFLPIPKLRKKSLGLVYKYFQATTLIWKLFPFIYLVSGLKLLFDQMTKNADIRYIVSSTTTNQNGFLSLSEWLLATSVDEPLSGFWVAQTAFRAVVQIGLNKFEFSLIVGYYGFITFG